MKGIQTGSSGTFITIYVGDALIFQVEGPMEANEKMSVTDLLDRNEETIMKTAMNMVEHFSKILGKLPEHACGKRAYRLASHPRASRRGLCRYDRQL
ncbi:MAG: hypothetical protein R3F51_21820 [Cyanobacteriota/Melainabacteria group bacterium]